jgi:hypothetical protein
VAATLISQQLDTPTYRPHKRKHAPELSDASSTAPTTVSVAAVARTEGQSRDASRLRDSLTPPNPNADSQDKQLHIYGSDRGCIPISPASASPNQPESARSPAPSLDERQSPLSDFLPAAFADLKESLRTKVPMIGNEETVEHLWHIFNYIKTTSPSRAGTRSEFFVGSSPTSATDERNRVLGTCITREEQNQGQLRLAKSLSGLRKRLYLVELIRNYLDKHEAWEENGWSAIPPEQVYGRSLPGNGRVEGYTTK